MFMSATFTLYKGLLLLELNIPIYTLFSGPQFLTSVFRVKINIFLSSG